MTPDGSEMTVLPPSMKLHYRLTRIHVDGKRNSLRKQLLHQNGRGVFASGKRSDVT
jgi:hypothetical protein